MKRDSSVPSMKQYMKQHHLDCVFPEPFPHGVELFRYQKGEFLCRQGEPMSHFHLLVSGKAQVIPSSEDGRIVLLTNLVPIDMLGDIELLSHCDALHDVCAASDLVTLAIPKKVFSELMRSNLPFVQLVCQLLADKIYKGSMQQSSSLLYPLPCRLSRYLLNEAQTANSLTIEIHMYTLAQELGISDRHLRRILNDFKQEGILIKNGHNIVILNPERLQTLSHDAESS